MKKPVKSGEDFIRDSSWNPIIRTKKGAQLLADRHAKKLHPIGKWYGVVFETDAYYRINAAGMPTKRTG